MIVGEAVRMGLVGVVTGVLVAYAAGRAMSTLLFGVRPGDPLTVGLVALVCFATVAAACARPAWRAAHIDPITALKAD
jgi:putative ABC transport system permease protein